MNYGNRDVYESLAGPLSRTLAFDALGMAAFSLIARPAFSVSIEQLQSDIDTLAKDRNSINYRLNQAASWLCRPSLSRTEDLKKLALTLKTSNPFAFTILQSLGAMHMHMFYMREPERQRLCAALGISFKDSRKTDPVTNKQKTLPNKATR